MMQPMMHEAARQAPHMMSEMMKPMMMGASGMGYASPALAPLPAARLVR